MSNRVTLAHSPQDLIRILQTELQETNREVMALTVELDKRVEERTAALSRAQNELEQKNQHLEAAYREMETFTHSVAHDLRAPLRHLQSFAHALSEDYGRILDEQGKDYLQRLIKTAEQMSMLFDELLRFARTSQHPIDRRQVDLDSMVRQIVQEFQAEAGGRPIQWLLSPLPAVQGDALMLRQVWVNLIGNAFKYTRHQANPRIEILQESRNGEHVFSVRDNGVGFDMRYAEKLFNIFQRLHSGSEFEGTGVGLALVRSIIERHGGRVWAESSPGNGAVFYFSLPREQDSRK
jgi:light-regulated signal transduction histidine kinase (bacteriophytochrome)